MPSRPSVYLTWTDGASPSKVREPPSGKKLAGWLKSERPPYQYMNWLFWLTDQWIQYLDSELTSILAILDTIGFFQAKPTGAVNGTNTDFTLPHSVADREGLIVTVDGEVIDEAEWDLVSAGTVVRFHSGSIPQIGQKVYCFSYTGNPGGGGGGGGSGGYVVQGSPASPTLIGTGGLMSTADQRLMVFCKSTGGAVIVTANPQITAGGTVGQELVLVGESDTDYPIFQDGNGLALNGAKSLKLNVVISLFWDGNVWVEQDRS